MSCNCKYITLFRGDDSNFEFNQKVSLVIKTDLDLSGCSAHFSLLGVQQDFEPIPADKTLELVFPSAETSKFPLGMANGKLWLTDAEGRIRTVSNSIHFYITKDVEKAYGDSAEQTISVDIQNIGNYNALANKPSINGVTLIGNKTGEELGLADESDITYISQELTRVEDKADSAASDASSAQSTADTARHEAAAATTAAQAAQQTADSATSALDGKRDVTDLSVRGNPTGEGSWFSVNGDTYSYSNAAWTREGSPFDGIYFNAQAGTYVITGSDDVAFTLDANYSATVTYDGTEYTIIGYVDTIAKVSEIPTSTSQLTNDSGFITSADVHGDYIEDAAGNRINADRSCQKVSNEAPFLASGSVIGEVILRKVSDYLWREETSDFRKEITYDGEWKFSEYGLDGESWVLIDSYLGSESGNPNATEIDFFDGAEKIGSANRNLLTPDHLALESSLADKKDKQTPVTSPTASGNATSFIDSITQNANGEISATKKTIPAVTPSTSGQGGLAGLMSAADKEKLDGIAAGATAVTVDSTLSDTSTNPVQNKAVKDSLDGKRGLTDLAVYGMADAWECTSVVTAYRLLIASRPSPDTAVWASQNNSVLLYRMPVSWVLSVQDSPPQELLDSNTGWDATTSHLEFLIGGVTWNLVSDDATRVQTEDSLAKVSQIPAASASPPQMDGTASAGSGTEYSRGDHVHPSDTGKLDGAAAYPAWEATHQYEDGDTVSYGGGIWFADGTPHLGDRPDVDRAWNRTSIGVYLSLKQDALSSGQIGYINSVPNKADKVSGATAGNLASLTAAGNLADSGVKPSDFATPSDLPYALVTPQQTVDWVFTGSIQDGTVYTLGEPSEVGEEVYVCILLADGEPVGTSRAESSANPSSWTFPDVGIVATHPYALLDRAVNAVAVTGATTLTLPALATGKSRDFYLKMTVTGSQQVSFSPSSGITYTGLGSPSKTYSAGNYLLHFTETATNVFNVTNQLAATGSYNNLTDKPSIPTVDSTFSTTGAAADAKAVGDALRGKRDVLDLGVRGAEDGANSWFVVNGSKLTADNGSWSGGAYRIEPSLDAPGAYELYVDNGETYDLVGTFELDENYSAVVQTYHIECCVDTLATVSQIPTVPSAYTSTPAMDGVGAAGSSTAWAKGDHVHPTDTSRAAASDLPYALVTPGEWEFSGSGVTSGHVYSVVEAEGDGYWSYSLTDDGTEISVANIGEQVPSGNAINFEEQGDPSVSIVATRLSVGIHFIDRAVNAVSVTGATTFTLPALVNAGKSRDLLVRLTVSADAAVTFSASSGETITWDDFGSPTATYEAGTHLLRFTEVATSVFHFTDLGAGGSIDPTVLNGKLEATSAAPAFDSTKTYSVGEHVTYEGVLYECSTAVTTAGAWAGSTNWTATDMTSPDATLDLMADGRLRLVSADGEVLWMQGYGLAAASSVTLSCDKVNFHAFAAAPAFDATAAYAANDLVAYDGVVYVFTAAHAAGAWTGSDASVYAVALAMPTAPSGKVGDFVLDVDNTANASASVTATLTGAGTAFDVFTPEGVNLSTDILTFAGGEQCELYFTMTAFGTAAKPAWKVVKQVVEKQEFGS